MNWTGGWSGPHRKRKADGTYKDELPEAGVFMIILGGVVIFCVGGMIAVAAVGYSFTTKTHYSATDFLLLEENQRDFYQIIIFSFLGGGVLSLGGWFFTVWESRRKERKRKDLEHRLSQKWGD